MEDLLSTFQSPTTLWVVVGLVLLILEFTVPGLILFFFGLGAILTGIVCIFAEISLNTQLLIFTLASIAMLISLRRCLRPVLSSSRENSVPDIEEFIGAKAVVSQTVKGSHGGKVSFHGSEWKAIALETIPEGTDVIIQKRENLTLTVTPTQPTGN